MLRSLTKHVSCCRTLNNNNLTSLGKDMFDNMYRLRALRLSENNLICDCHLAWLGRWLRRAPRLGLNTKCLAPTQLKGQNVADLNDQDFKCSGKSLCRHVITTSLVDLRCVRRRPGIESWCGARFSSPVQTGPEVHPASYAIPGFFPGGKVAGAWR